MTFSPHFVPTRYAVRAHRARGARAVQVIPHGPWRLIFLSQRLNTASFLTRADYG